MMRFKAVSGVTPVSNAFIEEYMTAADSAMFSVIYIYGLKCACLGDETDNSIIAEKLGVLESDVVKAWKYWEKCGIVRLSEDTIEFLPIKDGKKQEAAATLEKRTERPFKPAGTMPVYTSDEMKKMLIKIPELGQLVKTAEIAIGKPMGHSEVGTIIGFHTWLGLPFEVIAMLITYCSGKPVSYMERVAIDWANRGISTTEEAESCINAAGSYREIMKAFGQNGRNPGEDELKYMNNWLYKMKMPLLLIKEACNRTLMRTGKPAYTYANGILEDWNNNGVRSMGELDAYDKAFKEKSEAERAAKKAAKAQQQSTVQIKPTAFSNYEQRVYSDEELSEIFERKKKRMKK